MSAINHMLQSLDRRGAAQEMPDVLRAQVRVVPPPSPTRLPVLWIMLVLGALAGVLWWQGAAERSQSASPAALPQGAQPAPAAPSASAEAVSAPPQVEASLLPPASRLSMELSGLPLPIRRSDAGGANKDIPAKARAAVVTSPAPAPPQATFPPRPVSPPAFAMPSEGELLKKMNPQQQADNEFDKAFAQMQQGRMSEAEAGFVATLKLNSAHQAARLAYAGLLLETKRAEVAEGVLREGLRSDPAHTGIAMALARIELERGDTAGALATLQSALPYADAKADYLAFYAALLQRVQRHDEAVANYSAALRLMPQAGTWWMGLGISLQAESRNAEARAAFQRALASGALNADLRNFVEQRITQLR